MTRKAYNFNDNKFYNKEPVDVEAVQSAIETELGVDNIPIDFLGDIDRTPVIETEQLPSGVTESEVLNAIKNNHPRSK